MTKELLDRMPECVVQALDTFKRRRRAELLTRSEVAILAYEYTKGLRDAGLITDKERQVLFIYTTV